MTLFDFAKHVLRKLRYQRWVEDLLKSAWIFCLLYSFLGQLWDYWDHKPFTLCIRVQRKLETWKVYTYVGFYITYGYNSYINMRKWKVGMISSNHVPKNFLLLLDTLLFNKVWNFFKPINKKMMMMMMMMMMWSFLSKCVW